jgi:serine O-acetyltransferase
MFYKEDFKANNEIISIFIVIVYRFGNWVYYKCKQPFKTPLYIIYKIIDFLNRAVFQCQISAKAKIGKGLRLDHNGSGLVIHPSVVIGENARLFHQVTIGINSFAPQESYGAATIGDNVYIGVGAKIIGKVSIGDNVRIGANAVVVKDIPSNCVAVGIPAIVKPIKPKSIQNELTS